MDVEKVEISCPTCKRNRTVTRSMVCLIRSQKTTGKCRSCSSKGNKCRLGTRHSLETRQKMHLASFGKPKTKEHRLNISKAKKGTIAVSGDRQWLWKGNDVGYFALHHWVRRNLGKPRECVFCGENQKRLNWASISHKAKRDLRDYVSLCPSCHAKYDLKGGHAYG